jgi:5'-nucleotidase
MRVRRRKRVALRHSWPASSIVSELRAAKEKHVRTADPQASESGKFVKILVSNDDGYLARGINVLADALSRVADVVVVAPDRNHSGASNSLTLHSPLRVHKVEDNRYFVNGTPSDCVHLALAGLLDKDPDLVVSGINHGANLGDDVIYSGTVAAAMEGRYLGLPAIAISLAGPRPTNFEAAARVAVEHVILNVNVPDRPYDELGGLRATRLGFRHRSEPLIKTRDPQGKTIYWIGPAGPGQDAGPGTDFDAIESGCVAVSPLKVDLTRHEAVPRLDEWLRR